MGSSPKAPKQTAASKAFEIEQQRALNEETISANKKQKALTRGTLGSVSLLSGLPADSNVGGGGDGGRPGTPLDGGTSGGISPGAKRDSGTARKIKKISQTGGRGR